MSETSRTLASCLASAAASLACRTPKPVTAVMASAIHIGARACHGSGLAGAIAVPRIGSQLPALNGGAEPADQPGSHETGQQAQKQGRQ